METRSFMLVAADSLLMKKKIAELVESINPAIEIEYHSIEDEGLPAILALLNTPSLLVAERLIVVNDAYLIETKVNDNFYAHLLKYINSPADFSYLVLVYPEAKETPRFQEIKKYSTYLELKKENYTPNTFILSKVAENGFTITREALEYLLGYGTEHLLLNNMLDSLICYKIDSDKEISIADIKELFLPPLENNVFELTTAVLHQDSKKAYTLYNDFKIQNVSLTYLLGLLLNKFQELYNTSILYQAGANQGEIAEIFNIKPGRAYYLLNEVKTYPLSLIKKNLQELNKIEYGIKNGSLNAELSFSTYLLGL